MQERGFTDMDGSLVARSLSGDILEDLQSVAVQVHGRATSKHR